VKAAGPGEATSTLAFWRARRYVTQGRLVVKRSAFPVDRAAAEKSTERLKQRALSREYIASLVSTYHLYPSLSDQYLFEEARDELSRHLRIDQNANSLAIHFTYPDAKLAQSTVSGVITRLTDETQLLPKCVQTPAVKPKSGGSAGLPALEPGLFQPDIQGSEETTIAVQPSTDGTCRDPNAPKWQGAIDVLDPASLPEEPDGPLRPILAIFGFFLGLGLWTAQKN
jgi:hypothetical protein